jgi:hypothetical protein
MYSKWYSKYKLHIDSSGCTFTDLEYLKDLMIRFAFVWIVVACIFGVKLYSTLYIFFYKTLATH